MKYFNQIAFLCGAGLMSLATLAGCEGGDLYSVDAPEWISQRVDSIAKSKDTGEEETLVGMEEDVYTFGNTDYSSGWWSSFSKYYVVSNGYKWNAVFNLNINPNDNTYYKNFALVVTNDEDRGAAGYTEYGAFRFDATGDTVAFNSQWGTYLLFKHTESNLLLAPVENKDANVQKLGGKITLTVDRSEAGSFVMKITNGTVTKTYNQPYELPNLNADPSNTNIRCFIVPEGSYIDFLQSNVEPIGGYTSAFDKQPISMELQNVPDEVLQGTTLEEAMAGVTALVQFEEGVSKTVTAEDLQFEAIPNIEELGEKTLVVVYNKTFKGENCDKPIIASASFKVVTEIIQIEITAAPLRTDYYFLSTMATANMTDRTLAFDPTGMEVMATYSNGAVSLIENSKLSFSSVPTETGEHTVIISTQNGKTAEVIVNVSESKLTQVTPNPTTLGETDNSSGWWSVHTDNIRIPAGETYEVSFTNYSSQVGNWNNFVIVLRKANNDEYAVLRADNYGWGNGYASALNSSGQADWATWLAAMNGAEVTAYITNCNNGTADVQAVMQGTDGSTYIQYYLGVSTIDVNDLNFAFTVDSSHYLFH